MWPLMEILSFGCLLSYKHCFLYQSPYGFWATVPFIMNFTEYKGAKIKTFTSIKVTKFLPTFILDLGLPPKTKFGSLFAFYFFSHIILPIKLKSKNKKQNCCLHFDFSFIGKIIWEKSKIQILTQTLFRGVALGLKWRWVKIWWLS